MGRYTVSDDEEEVINAPSDDGFELTSTTEEVEIVDSVAEPASIASTVLYRRGDGELSNDQIMDNWKLSVQRQEKMVRRGTSARTQRRKHMTHLKTT